MEKDTVLQSIQERQIQRYEKAMLNATDDKEITIDNKALSIAFKYPEVIQQMKKGPENQVLVPILEEIQKDWSENGEAPSPCSFKVLEKYGFQKVEVNETDKRRFLEELEHTAIEFHLTKRIMEIPPKPKGGEYLSKAEIQQLIDGIETPQIESEDSVQINSWSDLYKIHQEIIEENDHKITSGYQNVDELLGGGYIRGALYTYLGLSGTGKSIFLTNAAVNFSKAGIPFVYISTELTKKETFDRFLKCLFDASNISEVDEQFILKRTKKAPPPTKFKFEKLHPRETGPNEIIQKIRGLDFTPQAIIIDYMDELECDIKSNAEYERQGFVASGLKRIAEIFDVPVITATQTNRGARDKDTGYTKSTTGMGDLGDSFNKVKMVNTLLGLVQQRQDKENKSPHQFIRLYIDKNRSGKNQVHLYFKIEYQKMKITEITKEDYDSWVDMGITKKQLKEAFSEDDRKSKFKEPLK